MWALQYTEYGGPEVISLGEAPEPHAGPGQIRIVVRAAGVNPIDWKVRSGMMAQGKPLEGVRLSWASMRPVSLTRSEKASPMSPLATTCSAKARTPRRSMRC